MKADRQDGETCKLNILFSTTCESEEDCPAEDRTVVYYTFEDRTVPRDWFNALAGVFMNFAFVVYFTPIGILMSIIGRFGFMQ